MKCTGCDDFDDAQVIEYFDCLAIPLCPACITKWNLYYRETKEYEELLVLRIEKDRLESIKEQTPDQNNRLKEIVILMNKMHMVLTKMGLKYFKN